MSSIAHIKKRILFIQMIAFFCLIFIKIQAIRLPIINKMIMLTVEILKNKKFACPHFLMITSAISSNIKHRYPMEIEVLNTTKQNMTLLILLIILFF